jgi:outer membrane cobalamin receptor
MRRTIVIPTVFFLVLFLSPPVLAQKKTSDTLRLTEVEVKATYLDRNQGFKKEKFDSVLLMPHLNNDLSTILTQYSTIFIKSYGNGNLSTPSFRGTAANHTDVEWNGISINSPMLGQSDLSQVPVSQFDGLEILYGAAGISKTGGAFGGVLNLVTSPEWDTRLTASVAQTVASFNTYTTNAGFSAGNESVQAITKLNFTSSLNDFPYYNDQYGEWKKMENASYKQGGLSEDLFFKLNKKNFLTAKAWYSQDFKNLSETQSASMRDRALRSLAEWKYLENKYSVTVRSAFVYQFMNYKDTLYNDNHEVYSWLNRARASFTGIRNLVIKPGLDVNLDWAVSTKYMNTKTRQTLAAFSEFNFTPGKKTQLSFVLREELIDGKFLPLIASLGANYKPFTAINLSFSGNIYTNNRYPSLNDLYWSEGSGASGNPDLKTETDYGGEAGVNYNYLDKKGNFFIETAVSGYLARMFDLIQWKKVPGESFFTPENVNQVNRGGAEVGLKLSYTLAGIKMRWENNYHYCKAVYAKATSPADSSVGKQVIYVPKNTVNSTLTLEKWKFLFSYNFCYVSGRYDGTDNSTIMPGYDLSNIIFGKTFGFKNIVLNLQLQINNLFDLDYQAIKGYPMPGRNYALTLRFNFSK